MIVAVPEASSGERIVVVSPHLDDGVLSLGASIAAWSRAGVKVELLTVLGCDPDSLAPAGGWDRRGGFATEGESARARREEDRLACAAIGAKPVWLPFGSVDFERHGDEADVRRAVTDAVAGADLLLLPGFPLSHPDHDWLAQALVSDLKSDTSRSNVRIGLYAEQPYTRRAGEAPRLLPVFAGLWDRAVFEPVHGSLRARLAKWRAIRQYRSQLPLLGMQRSLRRGPHRYALAPEWIARAPG